MLRTLYNRLICAKRLRIKRFLQITADGCFVLLSFFLALQIVYGEMPGMNQIIVNSVMIIILINVFFCWVFGLYSSLWKNAGIEELIRIVSASIISTAVSFLFMKLYGISWERSVYFIAAVIYILFSVFLRLRYSIFRKCIYAFSYRSFKRTMIIGAGDTGSLVIRQLKEAYVYKLLPVVVVDDDSDKMDLCIHGIRIEGDRHSIARLVKKYRVEVILYCAPTAKPKDRHEILKICSETGCVLKIIPDIIDIIANHINTAITRIEMTDLLTRSEHQFSSNSVNEYIKNECIFVTGGGGSIGSELCRQIASFSPARLIIFDIYENNAYELMIELRRKYPNVDTVVEIGTVMDGEHLEDLFARYLPSVVFHAAAHKHVQLMENNPREAVKNNVFGTWNIAKTADKFGTLRFVLISTDKAVNPTNVMGATKRLAEQVIQFMNSISATQFIAVRFGNVLGSNGSVIPLFKKQIEHGGPVTVTHKDVTRYCMTIFEAVQLVLQAAGIAALGEIFILDMGEQLRIDDIARTLIRLSGYKPDEDIKIVYTGLRPGEKISEELAYKNEEYKNTGIPGLFVCMTNKPPPNKIQQDLEWLKEKVGERADMRKCLEAVVDAYYPYEMNEHHTGNSANEHCVNPDG